MAAMTNGGDAQRRRCLTVSPIAQRRQRRRKVCRVILLKRDSGRKEDIPLLHDAPLRDHLPPEKERAIVSACVCLCRQPPPPHPQGGGEIIARERERRGNLLQNKENSEKNTRRQSCVGGSVLYCMLVKSCEEYLGKKKHCAPFIQ
jgi:hypothetical protein